ncbi:VOC family protein [Caulobacter sp. UNC358MFTsu5.1]|uniref:VOC family protein n=1 Tax=Caulobacter sp. UNC358MFTsu5.1 TaxID=1449049 RepID=UPI0004A6DAB8|nr:VOC family protein [Caulobacter sp. UNC358MFTsu5.1]
MQKITPFLWFDTQAEEAANFYVSLFPNSKIKNIARYPSDSPPPAGPPGKVMTVDFELDGQAYTALNGGPHFTFTEAVSFMVHCADQAEVDRYWDALTADGGKESQCGWLKDKYGLSWQIVPQQLMDLYSSPDKVAVGRMFAAMMKMVKLDMPKLKAAFDGETAA